MEYAEHVKRDGRATEKAVRRWGSRKEVTLNSEVDKAVAAAESKFAAE